MKHISWQEMGDGIVKIADMQFAIAVLEEDYDKAYGIAEKLGEDEYLRMLKRLARSGVVKITQKGRNPIDCDVLVVEPTRYLNIKVI